MKLTLLTLLSLASISAQATPSEIVCAGTKVHYVLKNILSQNISLTDEDILSQVEFVTIAEFSGNTITRMKETYLVSGEKGNWDKLIVTLDPGKMLANGGSRTKGWEVSEGKISVLIPAIQTQPAQKVEETVTCKHTWSMGQ